MSKRIFSMVIVGWSCAVMPAMATEPALLELGVKPTDQTIITLGTVPPIKTIEIDLGALRTDEAKLPPLPLTIEERMALRAKHAVSRQAAVTNSSRKRAEAKPKGLRSQQYKNEADGSVAEDLSERGVPQDVVLFDESGQPSVE